MGNKGKVRYAFASSNTTKGFFTFIEDLINGLDKVYILKGPAGTGKSTFIRLLGEELAEQGYEVEFWLSAVDPGSPDGLYVPQLGAAVINGSLPRAIDPRFPGVNADIINLWEYRDKEVINARSKEIKDLADKVEKQNIKAYNILKSAGAIKEEIKKHAAVHLDYQKLHNMVEDLNAEILIDQSRERHYFASAITADGMLNYIDEISNDCRKRYIFKGPSGSGKSAIINEIARNAKENGYILEYYHCGLDAEGVVMLVIRNLQVALIDSGSTEIAIRPWDVIIDTGSCLDNYDSDIETNELYRNYETFILDAQIELENSYRSLKQLRKINASAMHFDRLDERRLSLLQEITGV